ncbi:MAG: N-6 DNA methylase [Candidatus Lokiarchaeota archaeon]|nr:N-6 DNA methylase [Candidatus Lokiarchaeota archaeon]
MPNPSFTPSWTTLSYSLFDKYVPLIKRWAKNSKSTQSTTQSDITDIFVKIFYITTTELLMQHDYSAFFHQDFLKKYNLDDSHLNHPITTFPQLFDISSSQANDHELISFYGMLIHRLFKSLAKNFTISLNSSLNSPKNPSFMKSYELKMLVQMCYSDFYHYQKSFFEFGGIPALFSEFIALLFDKLSTFKTRRIIASQKKQTGSIFTPIWIIELILKRLQSKIDQLQSPLKLADLSVGYGGFFEAFIGLSKSENSNLILYGYDTDPFKIDIIRLNFLIRKQEKHWNHIQYDLNLCDALLQVPSERYDILVGNPPWGARVNKAKILKIEELTEFTVKQFDSFGLFLIRNILALRESGYLYLVLPETILLNPNYENLRKFILDHTTILEIIHLGEGVFKGVNMPAIILGLKNRKAESPHQLKIYQNITENSELNIITAQNNKIPNNIPHYLLRFQSDFLSNPDYSFDIFTTTQDRQIIEKIEKMDCYRLRDMVDNSRGVEIGKKGEVIQCYHCKVWMPTPQWSLDPYSGQRFTVCQICKHKINLNELIHRDRIILSSKPENSVPCSKIILGEDIQRYVITGNNYIILNRRGIKYKSAKLYNKKKILVRKTSKELLGVIDYDNSYTIQVVYQFSLKEEFDSSPYLLEFILGALSSRIIQFYYAKKYQYLKRKNFPHHIQKNILNIPIPKIVTSSTSSIHYLEVVMCTIFLMWISYYLEHHDFNKSIQSVLYNFLDENLQMLQNGPLLTQFTKNFNNSPLQLMNNPSKLLDPKGMSTFFQEMLDDTVERVFLAL